MLEWLKSLGSARDVRIQQTAALLTRYGYTTRPTDPRALDAFLPWSFPSPYRCDVEAAGSLGEEAAVRAFEYRYSYQNSNGDHEYADELLVAVSHPKITGGAVIKIDGPEWGGAAAVVEAMSWLPPFVVARGIAWALSGIFGGPAEHQDIEIGHAELDRLYKIHAASTEDARRAVTPALRDHLVRTRFRGTIELRAGLMLYTVEQASFSPTRVGIALAPLPELLGCAVEQPTHPYR